MPEQVIVLGGGVAGMSAAHELIERGFRVRVFEAQSIPGGKARSFGVPGSGVPRNLGTVHLPRRAGSRRKDLPGEHGFRFFPRFYKHVVDTMERIAYRDGRTVADNLVGTTRVEMARFGHHRIELPARFPRSSLDLLTLGFDFLEVFDPDIGISFEEKEFFAERIWQILTSCEERRMDDYEKTGWWDFIGAETRSEAYQKIFGFGITRSLVASQAKVASTKTIGDIFVQLVFNIAEPGESSDRVLNGPTNEMWIQPWLDYLVSRGVDYRFDSPVRSINVADGSVRSVTIESGGRRVDVEADYYVAALPVEVMAALMTTDLIHADPGLASIVPLSRNVEWMNGIQFYLTRDVPITPGHVIYIDSPWALTSISQKQFWPDVDLSQYGDGRVRGILSVDISAWDTPGLNGKPARACTQEEVKEEVWRQLKLSLNVGGAVLLRDEDLHSWSLDPDIDSFKHANREPLLVNLINTWRLRPEAVTAIPNLFLASDYVRTYTDLATMEAANEAARRAVNGVIEASGATAEPCRLWQLHEPDFLEPWRAHDRVRYQQGLPWDDSLVKIGFAALNLLERAAGIIEEQTGVGLPVVSYVETLLGAFLEDGSLPDLLTAVTRGDTGDLPDILRKAASTAGQSLGNLPQGQDGLQTIAGAVSGLSSALSSGRPSTDAGAPEIATVPPDPASDAGRPTRIRFVQR
jgi:uncharacterized protein with NAD-binding domain and iron-sulfur cluster